MKMELEICRPQKFERNKIENFFTIIITDTFAKEGLAHLTDDIQAEINCKKKYLQMDFESNGKERYFLIAKLNEEIIGTIEYGKHNEIIREITDNKLKNVIEIGTLFVHPDFQRMGVGAKLFKSMIKVLYSKCIKEYCLDSGYTRAQIYWKKKLGEPAFVRENYWGKGLHHMIWYCKIK